MIIFTPNTVIKSADVNLNFDELKTKTDYLSAPDSDWIAVGSAGSSFANSWVDYGSPFPGAAFRKDALGYVHLKGFIKNGTTTDAITMITMPTGYKVGSTRHVAAIGNVAAGHIKLTSSGIAYGAGTGNGWLTLDNISYYAETV
jgi:hypothetical protein